MQFADKQIEQVKVATVEQQVDEAQHGCGTHHGACQVSEPHHRLDDTHRDQVQAWKGGDHRVPLQNDQRHVKAAPYPLNLMMNWVLERNAYTIMSTIDRKTNWYDIKLSTWSDQ